MKYRNASSVLPPDLLAELQKYAGGELLYIPQNGQKSAWGYKNGSRERYRKRNTEMQRLYLSGISMHELSERYCLSYESVKKIVKTQISA